MELWLAKALFLAAAVFAICTVYKITVSLFRSRSR
jgi:hypothetical protein